MAQNLRNQQGSGRAAKDVKNTSQLTPGAKEDAGWTQKNQTKEYVCPDPPVSGPLGGKNSGS